MEKNKVYQGDCLEVLKTFPDKSVDCCVTSPPYYGLRDYGVDKHVFHEVKRVLKNDGTLWLNIGDSYWGSGSRGWDFTDRLTDASEIQKGSKGTTDLHNLPKLVGNVGVYKNKDLIGIPWMLAFALRADGWYLRQDIIWQKPNPMPESVRDRCTKSHEYIFLLSKNPHYYYDHESIKEDAVSAVKGNPRFGGNKYGDNDDKHFAIYSGNEYVSNGKRNKRDVWNVSVNPIKEAHFATFPEDLISPCILAGCRQNGIVLDPFFGSGTTGRVARAYGRNYVGIELNPQYIEIEEKRLENIQTTIFAFM